MPAEAPLFRFTCHIDWWKVIFMFITLNWPYKQWEAIDRVLRTPAGTVKFYSLLYMSIFHVYLRFNEHSHGHLCVCLLSLLLLIRRLNSQRAWKAPWAFSLSLSLSMKPSSIKFHVEACVQRYARREENGKKKVKRRRIYHSHRNVFVWTMNSSFNGVLTDTLQITSLSFLRTSSTAVHYFLLFHSSLLLSTRGTSSSPHCYR